VRKRIRRCIKQIMCKLVHYETGIHNKDKPLDKRSHGKFKPPTPTPPGASILGNPEPDQTIARLRPATPPRHAEDTHSLLKQRNSRTYKKKTSAPKPLKPPQPCRSPRCPAPAGQPWWPAAAQKHATLNMIQQPQTRWWAHKNIPRATMKNQGSM
jgi:hypothetical protein